MIGGIGSISVSRLAWRCVLFGGLMAIAGCEDGATPLGPTDAQLPDSAEPAADSGPDADAPWDGGSDDGSDGGDLDGGVPPEESACEVAAGFQATQTAVAACRAVRAFERGDFTSPFDRLLADVSARRFEVPELSTQWGFYRATLEQDPSVEFRTYARIGDASAQVSAQDLQSLAGLDAYTGPALHCRDHALPGGYADVLATKLAAGGYDTSHVLLALMWIRDAGCNNPTDDTFYEAALSTTAALIDTNHAFTTDLEIEAAAFLMYLDEGERIPAGFASAVIANQQPGGTWSKLSPLGEPNGHTTGLALWYLHELLFPGSSVTMVNPNVRTP